MSIILAPITGGVRCCAGLERRGGGGGGGRTAVIVQFDSDPWHESVMGGGLHHFHG